MKLPRVLLIGHERYAVVTDRATCDADESDGFMDAGRRRIGYRPGLSADRRREVLLHEALHACFEIARGHDLDDEAEERVVDALTGPVLDLLRRNPDFVGFLQT